MTLIQMRDEIINKYGKASFEAEYIQYCFSHHDTSMFISIYQSLKERA